jgi:lysophosphatidylcholine acyltransferase/lyso-PAF acetyltransferase
MDELQSKPLKGWRFNLRKTLKYFGYGLCFFLGFQRIRVNGKRATRDEAKLFAVAPHSSAFDALALFFLDLPMVLSRVENANTPVVGSILKAMQPILVAREHSKKREDVIMDIKGRTAHDWPQLLIFPGSFVRIMFSIK